MAGVRQADDDPGRVLRLAPDCNPTALHINAAEGFLLSRIDGRTPWSVLREMGAMPPEEVDLVLEGWLARGIVEVDEEKSARAQAQRDRARRDERERRTAAAAPSPSARRAVDPSQVDEALDLPVDVQRRILEFETRLEQPYHELLGVPVDADAKAIKRAYFKLSKEYHPDRYFRRQIGGFGARLDRIFKKVTEAYELLSDPMARAEVERSMQSTAPPAAAPAPDGAAGAPRELSRLERLRARMPFRLPESVLADRRRKAADFFEAARRSESRGRFSEAASNIRLAIAFDPFHDAYKKRFGEVQAKAAEERATQLLQQSGSLDTSDLKDALRRFDEVLLYRPHDPEINDKAAQIALRLEQPDDAREYVDRALAHSPDVGRYHHTLAMVHKARGDRGHAIVALEHALRLDPAFTQAQKDLAMLRPRRAKAPGGMR